MRWKYKRKSVVVLLVTVFTLLVGTLTPFILQRTAFAADAVTFWSPAKNDADIKQRMADVAYFSYIQSCVAEGKFKTDISGEDITKGPRWWVDGGAPPNFDLGEALQTRGNRDSEQCNGADDTQGWNLTAFGRFLDEGFKGRERAALTSLGYSCSGEPVKCTISEDGKASIPDKIAAMAYFDSDAPTDLSLRSAAYYYFSYQNLTQYCTPSASGVVRSGNVSSVDPKTGEITTEQMWFDAQGGWLYNTKVFVSPYRDNNALRGSGQTDQAMDCKELAAETVSFASDYQQWLGVQTCKASPKLADASEIQAENCAWGWTHQTDYQACIDGIDSHDVIASPEFCFVGQGLPEDDEGKSAGDYCYRDFKDLVARGYMKYCIDGAVHWEDSEYCQATYAPLTSTSGPATADSAERRAQSAQGSRSDSAFAACLQGSFVEGLYGGGLTAISDDLQVARPGADDAEDVTTCDISEVGWWICPLLNFGAGLADSMFTFLADNFLRTNPSLLNTDSTAVSDAGKPIGTGAFTAWGIIRNIANVAFVIVFLIIVISQISGYGVTNMGVKKTLPRLIIGAIAVNLSFVICQLAVDVSNILGYSLKELLEGIAADVAMQTGGQTVAGASEATVGGGILAGLVLTVTTGAAVAAGALPAIVMAVVGGIIALFTVFLILIVRQALIVLLVVIAPLAFVAYMLPNTEQWFKRWRQTFTALLLVFPILGLLFGACSLASSVMLSTVAADNVFMQIVAYIVLVVPLFAIVPLLKGALNGVGNLGNVVQGIGAKAGTPLRKVAGAGANAADAARRRGLARTGIAQRHRERVADRDARAGLHNSTYKALRESGAKRGVARKQARAFAKESVAEGHKAEQVKTHQTMLNREMAQVKAGSHPRYTPNQSDTFLQHRATSTDHAPAQRAAAMNMASQLGRSQVLRDVDSHYTAMGAAGAEDKVALSTAISDNAGALLGKAPDLVKGAAPAFGNIKGKDMAGFSADTAEAHMKHLADLFTTASAPGATPDEIAAFTDAAAAFEGAITDVRSSSDLQASFGADVGKKIQDTVASDPAFAAWVSGGGIANWGDIKADGKIR